MPAPQRPNNSRKAPSFKAGHLDPHRARQLKKEWLAAQKIKAAYRAEKRRLGLGKSTTSIHHASENDAGKANGNTLDAQLPDEDLSGNDTTNQSSLGGDTRSNSITLDVEAIYSETRSSVARSGEKGKGKANASIQSPSVSSLREMAREAYSPASLHTHKSNPLHRRQHGNDYARRRVEAAAARGGRGERGLTSGRGRGRGQPDMAKRMGVLLEKIKRTT